MPVYAIWRRLFRAVPAFLITTLALSTFVAAPADASWTPRERRIHHAVDIAVNQKGDPYVWGYAGPDRFDCSGLTMFSFNQAGFPLPRTTAAQYASLRHISQSQMRRGDLMYFHDASGNIYHAAIFLGRNHGRMWLLHASRTGTPVKRDPVWTSSWYGATFRHRG